MSDEDRDLLGDADAFLRDLAPADQERVVYHDRFDQAEFVKAFAYGTELREQAGRYAVRQDYVEDFFADLFMVMLKVGPRFREAAEMHPSRRPNHTMLDAFWKHPELQQLREFTVNDPGAATVAIISMDSEISALYEQMEQARKRAEEQEQQREELIQKVQDLRDQIEAGDIDLDEAAAALRQAQGEASRGLSPQDVKDLTPGAKALGEAAQKAEQELRDERALFALFGMEAGDLKRMPFEERRRMAERLRRNRMAKFATMIGQWRRLADGEQRRRVNDQPDEIVDLQLSDHLTDLVPTEMVAMDEPGLDMDFWVRYFQEELVTYEKHGQETVGLGPMIIIGDESQSMEEAFCGATREAWMKAVALALVDTCRRQKRPVHYIGFAAWDQVYTVDLTPGPGYLERVIAFTEHFFCGGTDFDLPLPIAMEISGAYPEHKRPDFVFISDGDGNLGVRVAAAWTEHRDRYGSRSFGLAVGDAGAIPKLRRLATNVRSVLSLTDSQEHLVDLFRQI